MERPRGGSTTMHRLPLKRFIHVCHCTQTSCHQVRPLPLVFLCSVVPLCFQDARTLRDNKTIRVREKSRLMLLRKKALKSSSVIQQQFCLHPPRRKIRLRQDCPCTGLSDNPFCLPSLTDSFTCSLPSSIHLVLWWCPGRRGGGSSLFSFSSLKSS